MFGSKRITHDFKRYEKVTYEFYNIHKVSLALDLSNIIYITRTNRDKNLPCDIFKDISKLHRFSAREPFLNLNLNVEMCFSNPASLALNPLAASFNYVSSSNSKVCQFQNVNEKNPVTSFSNVNPYAEPFPTPANTGIPRNIPSGNKESAYSILQNLRVKNVNKILLGHT